MFRRYILAFFVFIVYRLLAWSWRKTIIESTGLSELRASGQPVIFSHWHGDELALVHLVRPYQIATMTSTSKDGALIDFVIRCFGGKTSRGSSTRGAVGALKGLLRYMKQGRSSTMAVDGPKGPIYQVKPGVFELSKLSSSPIIPIGVASSSTFVFNKAWNKAILPKPFSRVVVYFGQPLGPVVDKADVKSLEMAQKLKQQLDNAKQQAFKVIAQF